MSYIVTFYQSACGEKLVEEFLSAQDVALRAKFARFAGLLQAYGPDLGMPHSRNLTGGLYELRIRGKNEVRVFYIVFTQDRRIVLVHAFRKRTQKLPVKELEIARNRQKELTKI